MKSTSETYHTLNEFRDIHAKLGAMFKKDGITDEDRLRIAGQLTISSQLKELTNKVANLSVDMERMAHHLGHLPNIVSELELIQKD